jgi:hypothetical protein
MAAATTYTFSGFAPRVYPQYLNAAGTTLVAAGAGPYSITLANGWTGLPVPPGDGLWSSSAGATTGLPAVPAAFTPALATPGTP